MYVEPQCRGDDSRDACASVFPAGSILTPASGVTVTFAVPPDVTGPYQIFNANGTTTGSIAFSRPGVVRGEWWGARGDGVTDSAVAITNALNSGPTANEAMTVQLQGGTFLLGSAILPPASDFVGWTLQGIGRLATVLRRTAGYTGPLIEVGRPNEAPTRVTRIKALGLDCLDRAVGTKGIRFLSAPWSIVEDVAIANCEYGIHQSGCLSMLYRDVFVEDAVIGIQVDNQQDRSVVDTKFEHVHVKKARQYSVNIDGSYSAQLVREITLSGLITDGGVTGATGPTCLRIHDAERIRMYGIHLEECNPFLSVTDLPLQEPPVAGDPGEGITGYIQIYGAQLGDFHEGHSGVAIVWNTLSAEDFTGNAEGGIGSVIEGLRVKSGTSSFFSDYTIAIRNTDFPRLSPPTGEGFILRNNSEAMDAAYSRDVTQESWTIFRSDKLQTTHNTRYQERFSTENTVDANAMAVISVNGGQDSTHAFDTFVVGKRTDNTDQAAFRAFCLFKTNADVSLTTLIAESITPVPGLASAGAAGWTVTCSGGGTGPGMAPGQVIVDQNATGYTVRWTAHTQIIHIFQEQE